MLIVCVVIAWFHTLHNNTLTNIRVYLFWKKKISCCWKPINYLICKFGQADEPNGCQYLCRDKCFSPRAIIKQIVMGIYFVIVFNNLGSVGESMLEGKKRFIDGYLATESLRFYVLTFGLQHFFFMGIRFALMVFISLCCCGCPCVDSEAGELQNHEGDPFANRIISMNYEKYILDSMNLRNGRDREHDINLERFRRNEDFLRSIQSIRN